VTRQRKVLPVVLALGLAVALLGPLASALVLARDAQAAVTQSGTISLTPQIVQPGGTVADADAARLSGTVTFRPIRKGRPVVIQRMLPGGAWTSVSTLRQNGSGQVTFSAPASEGADWYTYRGVAQRFDGLKPVASTSQSAAAWGAPEFDDEFEGAALDQTKWDYRQVGEYSPSNKRACSASYPEAVEVGGGRVSLWVQRDGARRLLEGPCDREDGNTSSNRDWFKNGHISTSGQRYSFQYGVAAARVKFDRRVGAHGSFWLQSTVKNRIDYGPTADGAEVDVVEYFGHDYAQGDVYSFIHYYAKGATKSTKAPTGPATAARKALGADDDWFKKYHVFSVEWTPTAYVFRVDGVRTLRLTEGVSGVPEYLILSMLSSDWELANRGTSAPDTATQVDWVRVWEK
jgi:beta-glucanase (GH16 family)